MTPEQREVIEKVRIAARDHFRDCAKCGMAGNLGVMFSERVDLKKFKERGGCNEGVDLLALALIVFFADKNGVEATQEMFKDFQEQEKKKKGELNGPEAPKGNI